MSETFTLSAASEREEGAWVAIPNNSLLSARVLTVAKTLMPFKDRETGADVYKVKWTFQVTDDGQFKGRRVDGYTSTSFVNNENCKMYQWVRALVGKDLPEGFSFNTDDVENADCQIVVKSEEKPRKDGTGTWINNTVIDVRPMQNTAVSVGSVYAAATAEEEPF